MVIEFSKAPKQCASYTSDFQIMSRWFEQTPGQTIRPHMAENDRFIYYEIETGNVADSLLFYYRLQRIPERSF